MKSQIIKEVRENKPLIHHLTNQVVMNFSANGLLAFGGTPAMAKAEEEAGEMAALANGVLLNIGTLTKPDIRAMIDAGRAANEKGIPVVLDPVAVAATPFRSSAVQTILEEVQPTVIKGNAGELAHLVGVPIEMKGPDSVGEGNTEEICTRVAKKYHTTAVLSGKTDIICTGDTLIHNQTGDAILGKVTGAGCLLGSIVTACLTTDAPIDQQVLTAIEFYGMAADHTMQRSDVTGSGTFLPHFIDALALEPKDLVTEADNR